MHECAAGRACRGATVDTETRRREPALIEAQRGLCVACVRAVRRAVRELADDYAALGRAQRVFTGAPVVRRTPDSTVLVHVAAMALADELAGWAEAAMVLTCPGAVPLRQKGRGYPIRDGPVIEKASRVLAENLDRLLDAAPRPVRVWDASGTCWEAKVFDGIGVALKMQRAHAKVKGVLGETNPRKRLAMPCPVDDCAMPTLGINNGETDITCTSCGGRWSEPEYEWFAGMITGGLGEKEIAVLRWLLAEKTWELSQADEKLRRIRRLAMLPDEELKPYAATTFAVLVLEILEDWVPIS